MKPELLIALGGFLLGLIPYVVGTIVWYANSEKKKYAAERDFNHLRNNQKDISNGIAHLAEEIEGYFDVLNRDILEIKIRLNIQTTKTKIRKNNDDDSQ